ncbi:hypothetical protein AHMF7605_11840 [Adhaeribacter arboris]|uniref:Uncharacterized protein n=1 Tax=Adhaeribacter arboris TaxID=2072846 RepID=A0A2T2YFA1_9BACT|nr:hypothetical protein [Adhaeribacter arboris]PSR54163.1 hypothetical protein AHMF7605_11840 [Adhaeribacter arboris]
MGTKHFALKKIILEDGKEIDLDASNTVDLSSGNNRPVSSLSGNARFNFETADFTPETLQAAFGGSVVDGNWIAPEPVKQDYPDNAWEVYSIEETKITFRNLNQPEILKGIEFEPEHKQYFLPVIEQGVGAKFLIEGKPNYSPSAGYMGFSDTVLPNQN